MYANADEARPKEDGTVAELDATQIVIESVKIAVGVTTPILVAIIGFQLNRTMQKLASAQWANQKVIEKKIAVFDNLAPMLNDLYCYLAWVGNWKEMKPDEVVQKKRQLDKQFYIYSALFSPELVKAYNDFIHCCFETYTGAGHDARIKTHINLGNADRRKYASPWDGAWDALFSKSISSTDEVRSKYNKLMNTFSLELGLGLRTQ
jgi:hypothetical protein